MIVWNMSVFSTVNSMDVIIISVLFKLSSLVPRNVYRIEWDNHSINDFQWINESHGLLTRALWGQW